MAASVLIHALAALVLGPLEPWPAGAATRSESATVTTLADAQRQREAAFEHRARQLEALARKEGSPAGSGSPAGRGTGESAPGTALERARRAAEALEARERAERAEELSRLLRIPADEARARVEAEARGQPAPPAEEAAALARWEERAREAAQRMQQRAERQRNGAPAEGRAPGEPTVGASGTAGAGGDSSAGPREAGLGQGSGQGSGPGASPGATAGTAPGSGSGPGAQAGAGQPTLGANVPSLDGGTTSTDRRTYSSQAPVSAQAVAPGAVARARRVGREGAAANRIVLDRWYVVGPFHADSPQDLHQRVLPPELHVNLDAVYEGKERRLLRWRWSDQPAYPFVPQPRMEDAIYYAYTELVVDQSQDVWLDLGVDDDAKLWLNDALVWVSGPGTKPWYLKPYYNLHDSIANRALVEDSRRVRLQAGRNRLLLKLYNGIDLMFFSVVVRR